jgi:hypothetical protein
MLLKYRAIHRNSTALALAALLYLAHAAVAQQAPPAPSGDRGVQPLAAQSPLHTGRRIKPRFPFRWQVTNASKKTIFMYALAIDQEGRLIPFSPWDPGPILTDGLRPESTHASAPFLQDGELEIQEFHFIASPRQIYALLSPVYVATRGLSRVNADELLGATQAVERYTTMDVSAHKAILQK